MQVHISHEQARGCGYRKPSKDGVGIYLRGLALNENCERLPWPLETCPCCGGGFKPTRGFTWINPMALFDPYTEPHCTMLMAEDPNPKHSHERCWMCNPELLGSQAGLIWIGEKHYARPIDFLREADRMGISRKIAAIPNGFEVGEHAIFLAHRNCITRREDDRLAYIPGVFAAFKPLMIDLVIDDPDRVPDKALEIAKKLGSDKCRIVKVIPDKEEEAEGIWDDLED